MEHQFGFMEDARTSYNIFILKTLYEKYCIHENRTLFACFIDFRKAFDSIWHNTLFLTWQSISIGGPFYKTINICPNAWLYQLNVAICYLCHFKRIERCEQGDNLSPILLNIFINDVIGHLNDDNSSKPNLINKTVGGLLYADDHIILLTSPLGL